MNLVDTFLLLLQSATSQGILWALLAIGVFLTFRILDIADLTAEGSFPLVQGSLQSVLRMASPPY